MEPKNVISVVIGLFVVLVLIGLFGDGDLFTSHAVAKFSDNTVNQGEYITIDINNNLDGVVREASIIRGSASCSSSSQSYLDLALCNKDRCEGNIKKTISTMNLESGFTYKLRYKEFTSGASKGSSPTRWSCTNSKFRVQ